MTKRSVSPLCPNNTRLYKGPRGGLYYVKSGVKKYCSTKRLTTTKRSKSKSRAKTRKSSKRLTTRRPDTGIKILSNRPYTFQQRYLLGEALNAGEIRANLCDLSSSTKDRTFRFGNEKGSASETMIVFAKLVYTIVKNSPTTRTSIVRLKDQKFRLKKASDKIVVKASYKSLKPQEDNSLEIEIAIYERFIYKLANWNATPNVMLFLKYYKCPNFQETLARQKPDVRRPIEQFTRQLVNANPGAYDINEINMLVLERGSGKSLQEWMSDDVYRTPDEWFSILYQIFYTLECFNQVGFRHNDLHLGNVWIETRIPFQKFVYFIDLKNYHVIPITAVVKIYDFDRSYAWVPSRDLRTGQLDTQLINTKLQNPLLCRDSGQCNTVNRKSDAFNVLWNLYNEPVESDPMSGETQTVRNKNTPSYVLNWILTWFRGKKNLIESTYGWFGQLCKKTQTGRCDGDYEPSDAEMRPVFEMLETGFERFRYSLPSYDPKYTLAADFPNVFKLPSIASNYETSRQWEQSLEPDNIVPIGF